MRGRRIGFDWEVHREPALGVSHRVCGGGRIGRDRGAHRDPALGRGRITNAGSHPVRLSISASMKPESAEEHGADNTTQCLCDDSRQN